MASDNVAFSLRMPDVRDYQNLQSIAGIRGMSIAALAREYILDGLRTALDPVEIEREFEEEKRRLLAASAEYGRRRAEPTDTEGGRHDPHLPS